MGEIYSNGGARYLYLGGKPYCFILVVRSISYLRLMVGERSIPKVDAVCRAVAVSLDMVHYFSLFYADTLSCCGLA